MPAWNILPGARLLADVSLWSADLANLECAVARLSPYADSFHLDVADAHFVPHLLFFPDLVAALRPHTARPFHVHLMVDAPSRIVDRFLSAGADLITVHCEAGDTEVSEAVARIRASGGAAGLALRLETPVASVEPYLECLSAIVLLGTEPGVKGMDLAPGACGRIRELTELLERHSLRARAGHCRWRHSPAHRGAITPSRRRCHRSRLAHISSWESGGNLHVAPFIRRETMIVAMAGLPGTGKSTLARALADSCAGVVLDKDVIRSLLFPPEYVEYSNEQDDFCQSLMLETAEYLIQRHPGLRIFLDGRTFSRRYQIDNVIAAAERLKTPWRIIECICSSETARRRLADSAGVHPARNRSYELYRKLQAQFEPIPAPKLVIDTDTPLEQCVRSASAYLG